MALLLEIVFSRMVHNRVESRFKRFLDCLLENFLKSCAGGTTDRGRLLQSLPERITPIRDFDIIEVNKNLNLCEAW